MKEIELSLHNIKLLLREKVAQLNDQVSPKISDPSEQDSTICLVKNTVLNHLQQLVDDPVFDIILPMDLSKPWSSHFSDSSRFARMAEQT